MQGALDLDPPKLDRTAAMMVAKAQGDKFAAPPQTQLEPDIAGRLHANAWSLYIEDVAGPASPTVGLDFKSQAMAHIVSYLRKHGISSAEMLTDSCKLAGIKSGDDRHFGVVYRTLLREGVIYWAGPCRRAKGHASHGGSLYALERP